MPVDERVRNIVKEIVQQLVAGDYIGLERRTAGVRLSAADLEHAVQDYGRHLRMPPDDVFDRLDGGEVKNSNPKRWWVVADLWTEEEGRSDLSLEMTAIDEGREMGVEIDDLHVL